MEWINADKKMPKKSGWYLCCVLESTVGGIKKKAIIAHYERSFGLWNCDGLTVTHWMDVPQLPEVTINV